jgi:hypothetical protein
MIFVESPAQKNFYLKVLDANRNPIANATVALSINQIYATDATGGVTINTTPGQWVEVSSIGYRLQKKQLSAWPQTADTVWIIMEKYIAPLEPVQVSVKFNKTKKIGVVKRSLNKADCGELTGSICVIKIDSYPLPSRMESFHFYIPRSSSSKAVLRLRIFDSDSLGLPGRDILDSSIFISGYKTGRWNRIPLQPYRLHTPSGQPFFIGLELMPDGINEYSFMLEMDATSAKVRSFYRTVLGQWGYHLNKYTKDKNYTFYITLKTVE